MKNSIFDRNLEIWTLSNIWSKKMADNHCFVGRREVGKTRFQFHDRFIDTSILESYFVLDLQVIYFL